MHGRRRTARRLLLAGTALVATSAWGVLAALPEARHHNENAPTAGALAGWYLAEKLEVNEATEKYMEGIGAGLGGAGGAWAGAKLGAKLGVWGGGIVGGIVGAAVGAV